MNRSGYDYDCSGWDLIRWRGAVESAIRGRRGQSFLREMLAAMDALPDKRLIHNDLVTNDGCCAMGSVAIKRGLDVSQVDPEDRERVAELFGIAEAMAAEIADVNDRPDWYEETPEQRYIRVRKWVESQLKEPK